MCVLSFEDGMTAESWYAWLAFRSRVSMSAMGSVIVMEVVPLSPRFRTFPVGRWSWACRRTVELWCGRGDRPGRVERWLPAGLAHARELPGVGHLPRADPAQAELAEHRVRTTAPLAAGVAADRELRLAVRLLDQSLLGHGGFSYRLSGWWSRRADRRTGSRAVGAAHGPRRRSSRW